MAYKGSSTQRRRVNTVADKRLNDFINNNRDLKNQSTNKSILSTVSDAPQKFSKDNESRRDFILRNTDPKTGRPNSAAQAMLNFYDDGRNDYSRGLNSLRTSSQPMMNAYARKFPLENFAMKMGPTIAGAMTGIPFGLLEEGFNKTRQGAGVGLDALLRGKDFLVSGIDKGMSALEGGLDRLSGDTGKMIQDTGEIIRNTGEDAVDIFKNTGEDAIDIFQKAIAKREEPSTFTAENILGPGGGDNFISLNTSTDTPGTERIFKLPRNFPGDFNNQYFTDIPDDSLRDNYLVRNLQDPYYANSQQPGTGLYAMNLNQGGLASLNNQDYGMLMSASNFGF